MDNSLLKQPSLKVCQLLKDLYVFYKKTTTQCLEVDQCRRELFIKKGRLMERLPPTKSTLTQHLMRAAYQADHAWEQSLIATPVLPNLEQ